MYVGWWQNSYYLSPRAWRLYRDKTNKSAVNAKDWMLLYKSSTPAWSWISRNLTNWHDSHLNLFVIISFGSSTLWRMLAHLSPFQIVFQEACWWRSAQIHLSVKLSVPKPSLVGSSNHIYLPNHNQQDCKCLQRIRLQICKQDSIAIPNSILDNASRSNDEQEPKACTWKTCIEQHMPSEEVSSIWHSMRIL